MALINVIIHKLIIGIYVKVLSARNKSLSILLGALKNLFISKLYNRIKNKIKSPITVIIYYRVSHSKEGKVILL